MAPCRKRRRNIVVVVASWLVTRGTVVVIVSLWLVVGRLAVVVVVLVRRCVDGRPPIPRRRFHCWLRVIIISCAYGLLLATSTWGFQLLFFWPLFIIIIVRFLNGHHVPIPRRRFDSWLPFCFVIIVGSNSSNWQPCSSRGWWSHANDWWRLPNIGIINWLVCRRSRRRRCRIGGLVISTTTTILP